MTDLPTLIVDGFDAATVMYLERGDITARIDGPLPTVTELDLHAYTEKSARARLSRNPGLVMREIDGQWYTGEVRPLRVDDRVTLATIEVEQDETSGGEWPLGPVPFATATVANVECDEPPQEYEGTVDPVWIVTVTDVEPLQ